jgi:hypothetical protein
MATSWQRRRITRRLAGLLEPGEDVVMVERLVLGGWWSTTDRAVYVLRKPEAPEKVPFDQIHSVEWVHGRVTATIRTTTGHLVNVPVRSRSRILQRLRQLGPPTDPAPS